MSRTNPGGALKPGWLVALAVVLVLLTGVRAGAAEAVTCTSTSSGVWGGTFNSATWSCGTPAATDDIVIASGHAITLGASQTLAGLTIQSSALLLGGTGFDLTVTGNWSNSGTFTHNGTNVTLDPPSGTLTVSGNTTFDKLTLDAGNATVNFGTSVITIQDRLQHVAGIMQGGTSTFNFAAGTSIGGSASNGKRFHHLTIAGNSVEHSAGDIYLTGDLTVQNGGLLTFSGSRTASFNGSSLQTVTLNGSGIARFDTLDVTSGAVVRLPATADTQFTVQALTNNGALQQVKTGVSGATPFLTINNQSATAVYRGLDVTPGAGSPDLSLAIAGNRSVCNDPNGGSYRNRCFRLNSSAGAASSSITLHTTADEDDISNDAFYQLSGGVWTKRADCSAGDGDSCSATVDLIVGDNYFLIGDSTSAPTPVVLLGFGATSTPDGVTLRWETEVEIDFAGFYLWRGTVEDGPVALISPLIPAQGTPINGSAYTFLDSTASADAVYFYRLQAVDVDNSSEFFPQIVRSVPWHSVGENRVLFLPITARQ